MWSNEVLLVIVEEAHCSARRGNVNGMDYSRQPVEGFITQSNWDIYCLCMSPGGVPSLYSPVQTCIRTHTNTKAQSVHLRLWTYMFFCEGGWHCKYFLDPQENAITIGEYSIRNIKASVAGCMFTGLVGWFVSVIKQKIAEQISTKLRWRMGLCPE